MAARLVSLVSTTGTDRGCSTKYFLTFGSGSRTSTASTIRPLSENSFAMSSTSSASRSQYLHQVVQNSKRTTLPLTEALLNCSPVVVLARKRGAGCPVSSAAKARRAASVSAVITTRRRTTDGPAMGRNISTPRERYHLNLAQARHVLIQINPSLNL